MTIITNIEITSIADMFKLLLCLTIWVGEGVALCVNQIAASSNLFSHFSKASMQSSSLNPRAVNVDN